MLLHPGPGVGYLLALLPASAVCKCPWSQQDGRSKCRAWGLFGFCPGEAAGSAGTGAELPLGYAGAGDWACEVRAPGALPARGEEGNAGGLAAFVGEAVLSQLIALTPGQIPTPRWLPTDISDIEGRAMPFRAWPPFSLLCPPCSPPGPNSPLPGGNGGPGEKSGAQAHRLCQR